MVETIDVNKLIKSLTIYENDLKLSDLYELYALRYYKLKTGLNKIPFPLWDYIILISSNVKLPFHQLTELINDWCYNGWCEN